MRHSQLVLLALPIVIAAAAAGVGCHPAAATAASEADDTADAGDTAAAAATTPAPVATAPAAAATAGPAGTGLATGLPCDVQGVIENRCLACHGSPPANGAPTSLLSYTDLAAMSAMDPTKTRAQMALQLMEQRVMPPAPAVPPDSDEIASFAAWVNAGAPQNTAACTTPPPLTPPPTTLPQGSGGGFVVVGSGAGAAGVCTSGTFWTGGNAGSELMHPGGACNTCHQLNNGPNLRVGGTVFRGPHDPDDCNGAAPAPAPLTVVITDSRNRTVQLPVNAAGNFLAPDHIRPPLRAMVTDGVNTRMMNGTVTSGDCNACHTVAGANGAPGRIMAP